MVLLFRLYRHSIIPNNTPFNSSQFQINKCKFFLMKTPIHILPWLLWTSVHVPRLIYSYCLTNIFTLQTLFNSIFIFSLTTPKCLCFMGSSSICVSNIVGSVISASKFFITICDHMFRTSKFISKLNHFQHNLPWWITVTQLNDFFQ